MQRRKHKAGNPGREQRQHSTQHDDSGVPSLTCCGGFAVVMFGSVLTTIVALMVWATQPQPRYGATGAGLLPAVHLRLFVINLGRRQDRLQVWQQQYEASASALSTKGAADFESFSLSFERVPAVDGAQLESEPGAAPTFSLYLRRAGGMSRTVPLCLRLKKLHGAALVLIDFHVGERTVPDMLVSGQVQKMAFGTVG